jgi:hypothetical protein
MHVEAIYRQGQLELITPVRLREGPLRVVVEVPDEAVVTDPRPWNLPSEVIALAKASRERLDTLRHAPLPRDEDLPEISDDQAQRLESFALREDR